MRIFPFFCLAILLVVVGAQARSHNTAKVTISYPKFVKTLTTAVTVELEDQDITSLHVTNASVPTDKYDAVRVENKQKVVILDVNILINNGGENVFYVDAFKGAERLDQSFFAGSNKIVIKMVGVASSASAKPTLAGDTVNSQSNQKPSQGQVGGSQQVPAVGKLDLQASPYVTNASNALLKIVPDKNVNLTVSKFEVRVEQGDRTHRHRFDSAKDKEGKLIAVEKDVDLFEGENIITVRTIIGEKVQDDVTATLKIKCSNCSNTRTSSSARLVVGLEQIGASASGSKQSPFLDLYFDTPFSFGSKTKTCQNGDLGCFDRVTRMPCKVDKKGDERSQKKAEDENCLKRVPYKPIFSVWGNVRLSSIPVQSFLGLANISTFPTFIGNSVAEANNLAQSFDFMVGGELKLPIRGELGNGFFPGKTSMHLIGSVGAISPLNPQTSAQIFKIPTVVDGAGQTVNDPQFVELFPEAAGKKNIAFVSPERDKFYRQYFGGLRLKTRFFEDDGIRSKNMFPAIVDITVGQNESITGTLRGVVGRIDGSGPIPLKGADYLYIFGSAQIRLGRKVNETTSQFFLEGASSGTSLTASDTAIVPIDRYPSTISNRDRFRLGIGVDLFRLFKKDDASEKP